jgi:hypothetical protein
VYPEVLISQKNPLAIVADDRGPSPVQPPARTSNRYWYWDGSQLKPSTLERGLFRHFDFDFGNELSSSSNLYVASEEIKVQKNEKLLARIYCE